MALDALVDGTVQICIDPSLNAFAENCCITLEGQYLVNPLLAQPIVPDVRMKVSTRKIAEINSLFVAGSQLAEMVKAAVRQCGRYITIYVIPRADAAGAVKSEYTMTVTGPATTAGMIDMLFGDELYSFSRVPVAIGDTATTIAAAIVAALPASLPYTATAAAGVITFVAKNGGTVGNYFNPIINFRGRSNYLPAGVTFTTARTIVGAGDPVATDYATVMGTCCCAIFGLGISTPANRNALRDYIRSSWDCEKPQCFGQGYGYADGDTVGAALALWQNDPEMIVRPTNSAKIYSYPWLHVAARAAQAGCYSCTNPEVSQQGQTYGVLHAIRLPGVCAPEEWTFAERQQLQENGFSVDIPKSDAVGVFTSPMVVNDVTQYLEDENGNPNLTYRDAISRRLVTKVAVGLAEVLAEIRGPAYFNPLTKIRTGTIGTNKTLMLARLRKWAKDNEGVLFNRFDSIESSLRLVEDVEEARTCSGIPCKLKLYFRFSLPCRSATIGATLQPDYIANCAR